MISTPEADRLLDETLARRAQDHAQVMAPLASCVGRVLARDIYADRDQPPFDRVAMDGIAVVLDDNREAALAGPQMGYHIDGRLPAGAAVPEGEARPIAGNAIEVMTGAALPGPWNTVIPWEDLSPPNGGRRGLRQGVRLKRGMNVHLMASDYRQGDRLISSGTRITAPHVHILASVGLAQVPVFSLPRIALVATGDELVAVDAVPQPTQIRMSNLPALQACLNHAGLPVATSVHLPDDEASLRRGLAAVLAESDVVIISGAVSKGSRDFVPTTLLSLGCSCVFHGVAHKPGKPMWFGTSPSGGLVFGLPGNPVSSLICFVRYVLPRLRQWSDSLAIDLPGAVTLPLANPAEASATFTLFLAGQLESQPGVVSRLRVSKNKGSGNFAGLIPSDGLVELPAGAGILGEGSLVRFFPWP